MHTEDRVEQRWPDTQKAAGAALLSAYVSPAQLLALFLLDNMTSVQLSSVSCCGWCSAWPCDERGGACEIFNATSLTHPFYSIMSERISIVPVWIIPFLWCLCRTCNSNTAALGSAAFTRLRMTTQHSSFPRHNITWGSHYTPLSALNFSPSTSKRHSGVGSSEVRLPWEAPARPQTLRSAPPDIASSSHIKLLPVVPLYFILYTWRRWWYATRWPDWSERSRGQRSALHQLCESQMNQKHIETYYRGKFQDALVKLLQRCISAIMNSNNQFGFA